MKRKSLYLAATLLFAPLCFATYSKAQGYEMKEGEVIQIDRDGHILNTNMPPPAKTKFNPGTSMQQKSGKPESIYSDDGKPKIYGYTPTGNPSVDEQNYKKAKFLFAKNDPDGFMKWQKKYADDFYNMGVKKIPYEEFLKMPENRKQHIIGNPDKYKVVKESDK